MTFHKRFWFMMTVLVLLVVLVGVVLAQTTRVQQWEYAFLVIDLEEDTFTFTTSVLYEALEFKFAVEQSVTNTLIETLDNTDGAAMIDYVAAMGLSGYELVDTMQLPGSVFVYNFKRPAKQ